MTAVRPLDPRAPFVLDTRELGRRPGAMRAVHRRVDAPDGWSLELVRVPAGAPVELDLRLESVVEGVLVSGTVRAPVAAECGRCLEPVSTAVVADVQELYAYDPDGDDDEQPLLVGDFLDIEPLVRDTVVLGLPLNPVCDDDCSGLCAECGERLVDLEPGHAHDLPDPRWATLAGLTAETASTDPRATQSRSDQSRSNQSRYIQSRSIHSRTTES